MNLVSTLNVAVLPPFDYAALNDPAAEAGVRRSAALIRDLQRATVVDIGRELLAVKERLPHGQFIDWIEAEFGWGRRTAFNYMQAAAVFGDKWETVSHLPAAVIYKLSAPSTPSVVVDTVLKEVGPGKVISPRNVEALIDRVGANEARVKRRARLDEARNRAESDKEAQRARADIRWNRDERERQNRKAKAKEAVHLVQSLLGDRFGEFCAAVAQADRHEFLDALAAATPLNRGDAS